MRAATGGGAAAFLLVSALAACAENSAQTKAMCPGMARPHCLSGVVCDEDRERGCDVCRCQTPYTVPVTQPPQGAPQELPP